MSRSNRPPHQAGDWPPQQVDQYGNPIPQGQQNSADPQNQQQWNDGWAQGEQPQYSQPAPAQGYAQPGQPYPQNPADPYAQQPATGGHAQPASAGDPSAYGSYQQQPAYGQPAPAPGQAQPQFDAYVPPTSPPTGYEQQQLGGAPAEPYFDAGAPSRQAGGQWQQPDQAAPSGAGYDLGNFAPAAADPYAQQPHVQQGWGNAEQQSEYATAQHREFGTPEPGEFAEPHDGQLANVYNEEDEDYEYEEPRRSGRTMLMLGAVVGAVVLGGGVTLGYNMLTGGSGSKGSAQVVRGASGPTKVKPSDPGGKKFAHTDSKIMGRSSDSAAGAGAANALENGGGARKVKTLQIGSNGAIVPPAVAVSPSAASAEPDFAVPGMTVVGGFGNRPAPPPVAGKPARAGATTSNALPDAAPPRSDPRNPQVIAKATPPPPIKGPPKTVKKAVPQAKTPQKISRAVPPAAPAPRSSGGANGYVAVLASVPASGSSRMAALEQFANMQQKYGTVLKNKVPDVKAANLGARGTYHRLLVGPPGSRDQANSLCRDLKSAGFSGCWVTAY